jgi:hypothetical protein
LYSRKAIIGALDDRWVACGAEGMLYTAAKVEVVSIVAGRGLAVIEAPIPGETIVVGIVDVIDISKGIAVIRGDRRIHIPPTVSPRSRSGPSPTWIGF